MTYPFLDRIEDPALRQRVRKVLCDMEMLPEARAMSVGRTTPSAEPDHLPPEVQKRGKLTDKPPRERSLFERYLHEFSKCPGRPDPQWAFRLLCACAERDYLHHVKGRGKKAVAGGLYGISEGQSRSGAQVEKERGDELVRDYEGAPAAEVAAITQQREAWVRKARELRGRKPSDGTPKEGWQGWSIERRRLEIARRLARGVSKFEIAGELGISERTVRRHLPDAESECAA